MSFTSLCLSYDRSRIGKRFEERRLTIGPQPFVFTRTALFWAVTQRVVVIPYLRFGTPYRSHLQGRFLGFLTLADGTDRLPRTSVRNYQYSLRNNPEKRSSLLLRGGSLKSRFFVPVSCLKLQRFIVYRTVSMSVVLNRPSTLPLTLWEEHKLRVHQVSSYTFRHSTGVIIRET